MCIRDRFEDGFLDAVDKIKELMETGDFRDPIAERAAKEEQPEEKASSSEDSASSDDDIAFDDL